MAASINTRSRHTAGVFAALALGIQLFGLASPPTARGFEPEALPIYPDGESMASINDAIGSGIDRIAAETPDDQVSLVACYACGQPANACACGSGLHGAGGLHGNGQSYKNLFWCSPVGEVYDDPCNRVPCEDCAISSPPLLYASAEMIALARDPVSERAYQTLGPGGPVVLDTGNFDTEFDGGMRVTMGATLTDFYRIEASYLGTHEWSDRAAIRNLDPNALAGAGNLFSPFSNFGTPVGIIGADFNNFASVEMAGTFDSFEINIRRRLIIPVSMPYYRSHYCVANSFSCGLRYIRIDEQFGYVTSSTGGAGGSIIRADVDTENDLFGVQIGMLSQFLSRRQGWVEFEIKGGIFQNEASMRSAFENANNANVIQSQFTGQDAKDRTTFLGEISLTYNHNLTSNLTCRVGYNAYWLTGLALAQENMTTNIDLLAQGPTQIDHGGDVVYHGPSIGFIYAY